MEKERAIDAAHNHPRYKTLFKKPNPEGYICFSDGFMAGVTWHRDQQSAELAAANKRIKELDDMYLKLSQKYTDLYEKRK
jgi:hypothetical protein